MKHAATIVIALGCLLAAAQFIIRFNTLRRTDPHVTWLTRLSTGLWVALCVGLFGTLVVMSLSLEGWIAYDRSWNWWTLAWFGAGLLVAVVVHSIDTWKRIRKVPRSPLLPRPDEERSDPDS